MGKIVKIKEIGNKIYKSDKFPLIVFTIILALIHILMQKHGDDITFSSMCNNTNFLNCIILRYQEWTSRIIIEGILIIFANYLILFRKGGVFYANQSFTHHHVQQYYVRKKSNTTKTRCFCIS